MFNFNSTTINSTSLFGQSTPVNFNRTGNSFLFSNTKTTPPLTPFLSSNLHGSTTCIKPSSLETTTFHKYGTAFEFDKANKSSKQALQNTTLSNELDSTAYNNNPNSLSLSTAITANTTVASPSLNAFLFDDKSSKKPTMTFSFGKSQPSISSNLWSHTPHFTPFNFSSSKPVIAQSTSNDPMDQPTTTSVDLQLFRTMLTTQPFNKESAFLERKNRTNINLDQNRLHPKIHLYSSVPTKPIVLPSLTCLPTHANTLSSNKRKLADSFVDDDDNGLFNIDDGPCSKNTISKLKFKRPRTLDMNKIRSIVLGKNDFNDETLSIQTSSLPSENVTQWKKFPSYDDFILSKKIRLPKLTHSDYYTKPAIEELHSYFNEHGECFVDEFTISRKHYGSIKFKGLHMNLAGINLDRIVEIGRRQVTVYPDENERPAEGKELNCQAEISLFGVYPIDRSIPNSSEEITDPDHLIDMNYAKYLERMTEKFEGQFIDYDVYTGTWTFQVEHF